MNEDQFTAIKQSPRQASVSDIEELCDEIERLREHAVILASTAEAVERERCAAYCGTLAQIMECGAGELEPGGRLRQAEQTIRSGRHWPPNVALTGRTRSG